MDSPSTRIRGCVSLRASMSRSIPYGSTDTRRVAKGAFHQPARGAYVRTINSRHRPCRESQRPAQCYATRTEQKNRSRSCLSLAKAKDSDCQRPVIVRAQKYSRQGHGSAPTGGSFQQQVTPQLLRANEDPATKPRRSQVSSRDLKPRKLTYTATARAKFPLAKIPFRRSDWFAIKAVRLDSLLVSASSTVPNASRDASSAPRPFTARDPIRAWRQTDLLERQEGIPERDKKVLRYGSPDRR